MSEVRQRKKTNTKSASSSKSPASKSNDKDVTLLVDNKKKWAGWWRRFWTTWMMIGGFFALVYVGHVALMAFVFILQCIMYKEVVSMGHEHSKENQLPGFRHLQWFWFVTGVYFTYSSLSVSLSPYFNENFGFLAKHSLMISFLMYSVGVVGFVLSLRKGLYKYQFGMFAWCHVCIMVVVFQVSFLIVNLFSGMIWFMLPAMLIISNDMWAYFFGFFWGKTPLIKLSPKKTWEGFLGAFFATIIFSFFVARILSWFDILTCPQTEFHFSRPVCEKQPEFIPELYEFPAQLVTILQSVGISWTYTTIAPVQIHAVILSFFASIIAPFGGFFASGFKRAFNKKDFGDLIPGHGGVTDRMDCQILMGLFSYVYYKTFVATSLTSVGALVAAFAKLSADDQQSAFEQMQTIMGN